MNALKTFGVVLIVAGIFALAYGGFSYTKDTHDIKLGPLEFSIKETETVNLPIWLGVGAVVAGGLLLLFGNKK